MTGLYQKYIVGRKDGRDFPGEDHENAEYFVLDLTYDVHALAALAAYVESLRGQGLYEELADDLETKYLQDYYWFHRDVAVKASYNKGYIDANECAEQELEQVLGRIERAYDEGFADGYHEAHTEKDW